MVKQIQLEQENNQDKQDHAKLHTFVTLYVKNVPVHRSEPGHHIFATSLLPYEQCLSVLNIVLNRTNDSGIILKFKERLIFYVGFRRFASAPIHSQHSNGDKHKFERLFRPRQTLVATCFGPITYPPAFVIAFKEFPDGRQELVATCSILSVNPDRLVLKRIVLSGHPFKIHKKSAVIRFMFFNPGTHGHMKCQFDGILKSQDTVFMNLYKRVYPKWTYEPLTLQQQQQQSNEVWYSNKLKNNINTFDNVSELMLYQEAITLKKSYHFPNVTSLTLESELDLEDIDDHPLQIEHIHILKMIVNLSNLKHLTISLACEIESPLVLLQLLKETSQLSSISIELQHLQSFFNDDELCKYLNQMITRLDVHRYRFPYKSFDNAEKIKQFCKKFSNLEQLICHINQENDLLFLLIHLPKLSIMEIRLSTLADRRRFICWLEDEAQKLNLIIHTDFENDFSQTLYIWIDRYQKLN